MSQARYEATQGSNGVRDGVGSERKRARVGDSHQHNVYFTMWIKSPGCAPRKRNHIHIDETTIHPGPPLFPLLLPDDPPDTSASPNVLSGWPTRPLLPLPFANCTCLTPARHVAISYGWRPLRRHGGQYWTGPSTAGDKSEIHTRKQMQLIAVHVERVHGQANLNLNPNLNSKPKPKPKPKSKT